MSEHRLFKCKHGTIIQQCRCYSDRKRVVIVDCPPDCAGSPVYCGLCGDERLFCPTCGRICDCGEQACATHAAPQED